MDKRPTASGLSPERLAQLWNIGSDAYKMDKGMDPDDQKIALLQDRLAGTLPNQPLRAKSEPKDRTNLQSAVSSLADLSIERLLQNPETDVAMFRKIKDYAKTLSDNAESRVEYHVANTIYYAAIAGALVFHNRKITKFSYKELDKYFRRLATEDWIPASLRSLFARAAEYSRIK